MTYSLLKVSEEVEDAAEDEDDDDVMLDLTSKKV